MKAKKRVIIIGGGFGGLSVAKALKKADMEITLIDRANHHVFQPLLYQVASAALSPSSIASPLREILRRQANISVIMKEVVNVDKASRAVFTTDGSIYHYDYLVLAPGARHAYFGNPQWEEFAPGLKTIDDALNIRERILAAFEKAECCEDPIKRADYMRFVIVGGGPTGVELAGAVAEMATQSLAKNFRHIHPEKSEIILIEGLSELLPSFPPSLAQKAHENLEKMGVTILTSHRVTDIDHEGIHIGEKFIATSTVIWAAGNQASPLLQTLNTPLDKYGRALVNVDLSLPHHPEIFVIGDATHFENSLRNSLPGIASVAIQQGRYVGKLISQDNPTIERRPFNYFDKGMMAIVGRAKAIAVIGKIKISGFIAWLAWGFIHIFYLIGFQNRIFVLMHWLYLYLAGSRVSRLIIRNNKTNF